MEYEYTRENNFGLDFTPSKYQADIFDYILHGHGNIVVRALAGSGKTKVLISAMKLIPKDKSCLFIAFNKSIVNELKEKIGKSIKDRKNIHISTVHSLGYSMLKRNLNISDDNIVFDEFKYKNYIRNNISTLSSIENDCLMTEDATNDYIDRICDIINFARFNLANTIDEIKSVAEKYMLPYNCDECEMVFKILNNSIRDMRDRISNKNENVSTIDYTDMIWLPYALGLKPIGLQFDWVFCDEVQDFSKAYVDMLLRCFKRGTRFCAVGDEFQRIYLFSGSSEDAFNYMCHYPNTKIFSLPISYRCDKSIINLARDFVPDIQSRDGADEGRIYNNVHVSSLVNKDMVISRSNAPLLKLYVLLIQKNKKCYVKGKDKGDTFINIINNTKATVFDIPSEINGTTVLRDGNEKNGLFYKLYNTLVNNRDSLIKNNNFDIHDANTCEKILNEYDIIQSLRIIGKDCHSIEELKEKIKNIFVDDNREGIILSTIHKAKGLEANRVFVLCRSTMPRKNIKRAWESVQEDNLIYVAITRAKHVYGNISEKEVSPSYYTAKIGSSLESTKQQDEIDNDFENIEKQLYEIYGREKFIPTPCADIANFQVRNMDKVIEKHTDDNMQYINPIKVKKDVDELIENFFL